MQKKKKKIIYDVFGLPYRINVFCLLFCKSKYFFLEFSNE